ncbi:MAG: GTP 3',8-cyclase MoaA [Armatimonadetes bacterium]|nr:GTP 3',8-cyclase MoaA [Armatimonadota bacterium]
MATLVDGFGRVATNLRISVTDRCNMRCRYCMPAKGLDWLPKDELLSFEEIARLTRIFVSLGVDKVRLTGGEPLVRPGLAQLVGMLSNVPELKDLGLTTNGYYLEQQVSDLVNAGLQRVNVSLDSLKPEVFREIVRRDFFERVIAGLHAAKQTSLRPIKVNVVMLRGINDSEIEAFGHFARTEGFVVRFIEFMPIGKDDGWTPDSVVPTSEIKARLETIAALRPLEADHQYPAERYAFADGLGEIGFISSVTEPFCESCNRIRITSDGKLRTCLFALDETDLRTPLRRGVSDEELAAIIKDAVSRKWAGHLINQPDFVRPDRTMSSIGG